MNNRVKLAPGLTLANPVMTASGTFGYGEEYAGMMDIQRLGAIVSKGTTLTPRDGNPQPRLAETPDGMLNAIGLQNVGVDALIRDKAPVWAAWRVPVIVNIVGETVEGYAELARKLTNVTGVAGLEVNVSCPNVKAGGCEFGSRPESAAQVTAAVRAATTLPVVVKLTPNTDDIAAVAKAVARAGADTVCVINTPRGLAIDINTRKPVLGNITGGLSGPAVKPIALYMTWAVANAISIPVIGCGGITTARDALEFIMAGASAVQVGSASFANPRASLDVLEGIEKYLAEQHIEDIETLVGAARKA